MKHFPEANCAAAASGAKTRRGLSLIEVLVVMVVIAVLATLLLASLKSLSEESKTVECMNNLRQIAQATEAYYADHLSFPSQHLKGALGPYLKNEGVFTCPCDRAAHGDSYSQFYVARSDEDVDTLFLACPRHRKGLRAATMFGTGRTTNSRLGKILWNGQRINPGDTVTGGELKFEDGSTAVITEGGEGLSLMIMTSFRKKDGVLHSVLKLDRGQTGTVEFHVTPGSIFEVITPTGIAGVRGTDFLVSMASDGITDYAFVYVTNGSVGVDMTDPSACMVVNADDTNISGTLNALIHILVNYGAQPAHVLVNKVQKLRDKGIPIQIIRNSILNPGQMLIIAKPAMDTTINGWPEFFGKNPLKEGQPNHAFYDDGVDDVDDDDDDDDDDDRRRR